MGNLEGLRPRWKAQKGEAGPIMVGTCPRGHNRAHDNPATPLALALTPKAAHGMAMRKCPELRSLSDCPVGTPAGR